MKQIVARCARENACNCRVYYWGGITRQCATLQRRLFRNTDKKRILLNCKFYARARRHMHSMAYRAQWCKWCFWPQPTCSVAFHASVKVVAVAVSRRWLFGATSIRDYLIWSDFLCAALKPINVCLTCTHIMCVYFSVSRIIMHKT